MNNKLKIVWYALTIGLTVFLAMTFIIVNFVIETPLIDISQVMMYYLKMLMIVLTLVLVPASLKYINSNRYDNTKPDEKSGLTKYGMMCLMRLVIISNIANVDCIFYMFSGDVSFFYLAVIMLLAMMFMRGDRTPKEL